jgi:hypothetical protein
LISTPTSQFPDPLIYVSNRNIGNVTDPKGDTIAIFEFKNASVPSTANAKADSGDLSSRDGNRRRCEQRCTHQLNMSQDKGHDRGHDKHHDKNKDKDNNKDHKDHNSHDKDRNNKHHGDQDNRRNDGSNKDHSGHDRGQDRGRNSGSKDQYRRMKRVHGKREGGSLQLVAQVFTGLNQIRSMNIGRVEDGGDEFLVASGFAGTGGVVMFKRVDGGRNLTEVARNTDVTTRTSFVFV